MYVNTHIQECLVLRHYGERNEISQDRIISIVDVNKYAIFCYEMKTMTLFLISSLAFLKFNCYVLHLIISFIYVCH